MFNCIIISVGLPNNIIKNLITRGRSITIKNIDSHNLFRNTIYTQFSTMDYSSKIPKSPPNDTDQKAKEGSGTNKTDEKREQINNTTRVN